jgi:CheY-like chemotaxis protein
MMPVMDGVQAVRHIRDMGYTRPIIALTADAILGVREMFLANGFDDYISKPIQMAVLNDLLEKWIPMNRLKPANNKAEPEETQNKTDSEIEIPGINTALGLSFYEGDRVLFIDLLQLFVEHIPAELEKLHHVSKDSLREYAIDAHTIKGSSAGIGAAAVTETARQLEQMAKDDDLSGVLALNPTLIQKTETLLSDIREWLEKNNEWSV